MPSDQSSTSSQPGLLARLLASVRDARLGRLKTTGTTPPQPQLSAASPSTHLPSPEDITTRLADRGLEFPLARKVSQAYMDKAVEIQFLSQRSTPHHRAFRPPRNNKVISDPSYLTSKLRNSQKRFYRRDIRSLLNRTLHLATEPQSSTDASEEPENAVAGPSTSTDQAQQPDEEVNDVEAEEDGEDAPANADDEKALQEMSARSSALLSIMFERGFTFPRRYEKIKLANATGLTYRQIGIWFSNRRERNRPDRKKAKATSSAPVRSAPPVTRESTVESLSAGDMSALSPTVYTANGSLADLSTLADASGSTDCVDPEALFGSDEDMHAEFCDPQALSDGSRVPSLTMSVATLDSLGFSSTAGLPSSAEQYTEFLALLNSVQSTDASIPQDSNFLASFDAPLDFTIPDAAQSSTSTSTAPVSVDFTDFTGFGGFNSSQPSLNNDFFGSFLNTNMVADSSSSAMQPPLDPNILPWQSAGLPLQDFTMHQAHGQLQHASQPMQHEVPDVVDPRPAKKARVGNTSSSTRPSTSMRPPNTIPRPRTNQTQRTGQRPAPPPQGRSVAPAPKGPSHIPIAPRPPKNASSGLRAIKPMPAPRVPMESGTVNPSMLSGKQTPSSYSSYFIQPSAPTNGLALPTPTLVQQ